MAIKPLDIRRKEFKNSLRGYDQNQVDDFLDAVADEFEKTFSENQRMKDQVSTLRERLEQFDELEGSIRAALVHAEQAATDLRQSAVREADDTRRSAERDAENEITNAKREAEMTIQEAKIRSHQMLADTSSRVERVQESYEALREARGTFAADFRHLLKAYMSVMENMDVATAQEIETSLRDRLDPESIAVARQAAANSDQQSDDSQDTIIQRPTEQADQAPSDSDEIESEEQAVSDEAPAFGSPNEPVERQYEQEDPGATQRMDPVFLDEQEPETTPEPESYETETSEPETSEPETSETETSDSEDPETVEPEVEPSTVSQDEARDTTNSAQSDDTSEQPAVESSTEDSSPSEDDTQDSTPEDDSEPDSFFEEPPKNDERTSRAGRFLRRRG